jgi:hypothetical protein
VEEDVDKGTDWTDNLTNLFRVDTHLNSGRRLLGAWNRTALCELSSVVSLTCFSERRWVGFYRTSKWRDRYTVQVE